MNCHYYKLIISDIQSVNTIFLEFYNFRWFKLHVHIDLFYDNAASVHIFYWCLILKKYTNIIYFSNFPGNKMISIIKQSLKQLQELTCLKFIPAGPDDAAIMYFTNIGQVITFLIIKLISDASSRPFLAKDFLFCPPFSPDILIKPTNVRYSKKWCNCDVI